MKDIFGNHIPQKEVALNVYHDERKIQKRWLYHALCLIPVNNEKKVFDTLRTHRKESTWEKEIHFKDLRDTRTENELARRWIDYFGNEAFDYLYFYLLGVDLQLIEQRLWMPDTRDHRIYNRFFQIGLYSAIKWFFINPNLKYSSVVINQIFSHKRSLENKDEFHTRPILEILQKSFSRGERITFSSYKIMGITSDHTEEPSNPPASHFMQFVDIIMGTFSQIYDNTSNQEGKVLCADTMLKYKLPKKIMSINVRSRYYKKYAVNFFPVAKISKDNFFEKTPEYVRASQFYNERPMVYTSKQQMTLFNI